MATQQGQQLHIQTDSSLGTASWATVLRFIEARQRWVAMQVEAARAKGANRPAQSQK